MKKILITAYSVIFVQALFAKDAVWTKVDTAMEYWTNTTSWVDGAGAPLGNYPNGSDWDVSLMPLAADAVHALVINIGDAENGASGSVENEPHRYEVRSIAGDERHTLNLYSIHSPYINPVFFTVANPTGFIGYWTFENPRDLLVLPGDEGLTMPVVNNFSSARRSGISVNSSVKGKVGQLYGSGLLEKHGSGELVVSSTSGFGNKINVNGGCLTLEGMNWPDEPVGEPYVWLDASVSNSMTRGVDGNLVTVTSWSDCREDSSDRPSAIVPDSRHAPFLSEETANGIRLIDFGARDQAKVASLGPTNCVLRFPEGMSGRIREVFAVYRITDYGDSISVPVGDSSEYPFHAAPSHLFSNSRANEGAKYGDVALNGEKIDPVSDYVTEGDQSRLHVVSIGVRGSALASLNLIGSDRFLRDRIGGMRVAEILYYTNELTHAERASINRYLQKKWMDSSVCPRLDVGVVNLVSNDVEIAVSADRTASVGSLVSHAERVVKTGAGTLVVGKIFPEDAPIEVKSGAIAFSSPAPVSATPAENPYLWLDSTVGESFVFQPGNTEDGPEYVTEWHDRRLDRASPAALFPGKEGSQYFTDNAPWLVRNSPAARSQTVVDFGSGAARTWMWLDNRNAPNAFEGFIALRFKESGLNVNIFGSSDSKLTRNEKAQLVSYKFGGWRPAAALWTKDGVPCDPWDGTHATYPTDRFMVFSVSATDRIALDYIAKDRNGSGAAGCVEIGEFITYDRRLSDGERRATIDYLMRKWEGVPSPLSSGVSSVGSLVYADDTAIAVGSDGDLAVGTVYGGNGAFVKTGSGDVSLGTLPADRSFTSVDVEAGSLEFELAFVDDALFHFDAMDAASIVDYTVTGSTEAGTVKTNVVKWADTRGIDKGYAYSLKGTNAAVADPTLITVETRPGVYRPCVDFGTYASKKDLAVDSAGFRFDKNYTTVKEAYIVYADRAESKSGFIFADWIAYNYHRGSSGKIVDKTNASIVSRGYAIVDGEKVEDPSSYALPAGMHLIAFVNDGNDTTKISQLSKDRTMDSGRCGGNRICEAMAFDRHLNEMERTYLVQRLMAKWFGDVAPSFDRTVESLSLGKGGTFTSPGLAITVPVFSGSGVVNVESVSGVSVLNVGYDVDTGSVGALVVNGDFSFAETGRITLNVDSLVKLPAGEFPILTAKGVEALDLSRIDIISDQTMRVLSVKVKDGSLVLCVQKQGMVLIVR